MKSIRIYTGGYFNDVPINDPAMISQNTTILTTNKDLVNSDKNLIDPKMNALKLLNIVQLVAQEYISEIADLEAEEKKYQTEIDSIQYLKSDLEIYNKMKEVKGLQSRLSKFGSSSVSEGPKAGKASKQRKGDTKESLTEKLTALQTELAGLKILSEEEIALIQKKETLEELKKVPKEAKETKMEMLKRIEKYMDDNLDEEKLRCELDVVNKKISEIQDSLDKNERYDLFDKIIDYMNKNPVLVPDEKKVGAFVNKAEYPGQNDIKCEDLSGKGLGWFVNQKNKMNKEAGLDNEQKKLAEITTKLGLVNTITKVDINESTFNSKLDKYFYLIEKAGKQLNYDKVFDALVGFSTWNTEKFSSLYEIDPATGAKKDFIIVEEFNSEFYEIYRSIDLINIPRDNVFIFDRTKFTFTTDKARITDMSQIKNKINVYPVFYSGWAPFSGAMIDGLILYSKINNLPNYTRYYKKMFDQERFMKWLRKYCDLGERDRQHIYFTKPSPFITFIIANSFKIYFNILEDTDFSLQDEDYFAPDYIVDIFFKEKLNEENMSSFCTNIEKDFETIEGKTNDIKISNLIKKYINSNPDISVESIIYVLHKLASNHSYKDITVRAITILEKIQHCKEMLTSAYNFITLNHLYSNFKSESFKKDNAFKDSAEEIKFSKVFNETLSELNKYINYTSNQIFGLFFMDLLDDYLSFANLYISDEKELKDKYRENDVQIKLKKCLMNLLCSFYCYMIYNDGTVPKLINYQLEFSHFGEIDSVEDASISIGIRVLDVHAVDAYHRTTKIKFLEAYQLIFGGKIDGFENYSFRENILYHSFKDPRGVTSDPEVGLGRPMCGEVTILNFMNFLLFNQSTKKIDYTYLPDVTQANNIPLVDFYRTYNDIKLYNKDKTLINTFFDFYKHIPFKIIPGLDDKQTDSYGDYDSMYGLCVFKYNTQKTVGGDTFIDEGIELRCTYFNLLRVLSYVLKLEAPLDFRNIEANYNNDAFLTNALKQIVLLFKNPNVATFVSDYGVDKTPKTVPLNVTFKGCYLMLGRHSEFHLIKSSKFSDVEKKLTGYNTIFNNLRGRAGKGQQTYDVYSSVFLSTMKDNTFYSQINFKTLDEDEIIRLINALDGEFEELYVNQRVIKTVFESKKYKLANVLFDKFMLNRESLYFYFQHRLENGQEIDELIEKYSTTYKRLTHDVLSLIISKNRKDIVKNLISCGKIDFYSTYDFHVIQDKEMFNLLSTTISDKGKFEQIDHYFNLISPYFTRNEKEDVSLDNIKYLSNSIFRKLSKKIQFISSMAETYKFKNLEIILNKLQEAGIDVNKYINESYPIQGPGFLLKYVYKYTTVLTLKKYWKDYSRFENKYLLEDMANQALYYFTLTNSKHDELYDTMNLLCYIGELNENAFKNALRLYTYGLIVKSELGPIANIYFLHLFYNRFSSIVSSDFTLCTPICKEYIYRMNDEIINHVFSKEPESVRPAMRKMIIEYQRLYIENEKIYKTMFMTNFEIDDGWAVSLIKIKSDMNIFGRKKGLNNPDLLIKLYESEKLEWFDLVVLNDGSDELTNYIVGNVLNFKKLTEPPITSFKRKKLGNLNTSAYIRALINCYLGYTSENLTKLSRRLTVTDPKYTESYIHKNLMKVFNYGLTNKFFKPDKSEFTLYLSKLIFKWSTKEKLLIKCVKSILKSKYWGDLSSYLYGYNKDSIKATFDKVVKRMYLNKNFDSGLTFNSLKTIPIKTLITNIGNTDLEEIREVLGMY